MCWTLKKPISPNKFRELAKQFTTILGGEDIKDFLVNEDSAIAKEKSGSSSTHLVLSDNNNILYGYFTIASREVDISSSELPNSAMKKLIGTSFDKDNKNTYKYPTLLLAQFGRNFHRNSKNFTGHDLWNAFHETILKSITPFRTITVECKGKKLVKYYESKGFRLITYDDINKLETLSKRVKVIE